ncbi:MAG: hypothetical protein EOO01_02525 [Chitinophagaceae bacterium]|nr:MAG: hypothetical protein EOO01_02525 [Chitinophagaceae bacterium]
MTHVLATHSVNDTNYLSERYKPAQTATVSIKSAIFCSIIPNTNTMKLLLELKKAKPIDYIPFWARLIAAVLAAHLIISFDEPESLIKLLQLPNYYEALVLNTALVVCIVELINWLTRRLDLKKSWVFHPWQRLWAQFMQGVILPVALSVLMSIGYFWMYDIHIKETVFFDQYFLIIIFMVIIANAYYFMHFSLWVIITMRRLNEKAKVLRKMDMPIDLKSRWPTSDIALIQTNKETYIVTTSEGERLNWPHTLETTIDNLPYEDYFLINRSTIVYAKNISRLERASSRRILLILKTPIDGKVYISQREASASKDWLLLNNLKVR